MTGIELITKEREEQIEKHKYTTLSDKMVNAEQQLASAAQYLLEEKTEDKDEIYLLAALPYKWNAEIWQKMCNKPYKERLIIAGALIAAEIDRINE